MLDIIKQGFLFLSAIMLFSTAIFGQTAKHECFKNWHPLLGFQNKRDVQKIDKNVSANEVKTWRTFHSSSGKCKVCLPSSPEHVKQLLPFPEHGYNLRYDIYLSAHEKKAVYMMLVADYPPFVNQSHSQISLESFLNGLIAQNEDNQLIFADLFVLNGFQALDFFVQAKGNFFKGRAIMAKNSLYLLAMECPKQHYLDTHYSYFIDSFELVS